MKTRTDFVSNSSSSSFILSKPLLFKHYGISKQDITEALLDLYGGKEKFDSYCDGRYEPFKVYELPVDLDKSIADYGHLLSCWDQSVPVDFSDKFLDSPGKATVLFKNLLETVSEAYGAYIFRGTEEELNNKWSDVIIPDTVKAAVLDIRKKLGVKTAAEVLKANDAWLFVHFDDNQAFELSRMQECSKADIIEADITEYMSADDIKEAKKSELTTESYTFHRLVEILLLKLAEKGKLKLDDIDVLAECYPIEKDYDKDGTVRTWLDAKKYKNHVCIVACMKADFH